MLIGNIHCTSCQIYCWICTLVLTVGVARSNHIVRRLTMTRASQAAIVAGWACRIGIEITDSHLDNAVRSCKATDTELCVGHVQTPTYRVDTEELFVKEAAEGEGVKGSTVRADSSDNRRAARQSRR